MNNFSIIKIIVIEIMPEENFFFLKVAQEMRGRRES